MIRMRTSTPPNRNHDNQLKANQRTYVKSPKIIKLSCFNHSYIAVFGCTLYKFLKERCILSSAVNAVFKCRLCFAKNGWVWSSPRTRGVLCSVGRYRIDNSQVMRDRFCFPRFLILVRKVWWFYVRTTLIILFIQISLWLDVYDTKLSLSLGLTFRYWTSVTYKAILTLYYTLNACLNWRPHA